MRLKLGRSYAPRRFMFIVIGVVLLVLASRQLIIRHLGDQLVAACSDGDMYRVKSLVSRGADLDHVKGNGWSPLHAAAAKGHAEIVEVLLQHGADVNAGWTAGDLRGATPLHFAVLYGHSNVVAVLIGAGADVRRRTMVGTPADVARVYQQTNLLPMLLNAQGRGLNK